VFFSSVLGCEGLDEGAFANGFIPIVYLEEWIKARKYLHMNVSDFYQSALKK
jgi:hypothetical protein